MAQCLRCGTVIPYTAASQGAQLCAQCSQQMVSEAATAPPRPRISPASVYPVTMAIVAVNVFIFVLMLLKGASIWGADLAQLHRWGANYSPGIRNGEYWRLFTSMFIHIGILHLAFNMWALWNLGQLTEALIGHVRFVVVYLLTGVAGSLLSTFVHPMGVSAGASGAIFGISGVLIAVLRFAHLGVPRHALNPILRSVISFAAYNLVFGAVVPYINNSAHLGGFIAGLVLGLVIALQHPHPEVQ